MITSLQSLKQPLDERTEGNPFFLEESVRTLVETKVLEGERDDYRLAITVESTQVPATVQAVLAARIDRLPPEEKQLLQSASVIGEDVPFTLLSAITELPDEELASRPDSPSGGGVSVRRRVFFLIWNTLSSTLSPTKWRTEVFSKIVAVRCMLRSLGESRGSMPAD